jgi:hypothetical protein
MAARPRLAEHNPDAVLFPRIKMEYEHGFSTNKGPNIRFLIRTSTNPYGERTFEFDERVDQFWREKPQWVEDAKAALREGRYPERINIDALTKAEKETGKK